MNYTWIIIIVLYVVLTHLIAQYIGRKRKIGYGKTVLISVLFSPIAGLICTFLSKKIEEQEIAESGLG
jgi:Na+-driven multidrug efflux pump